MDAIITAGGKPVQGDPLFSITKGNFKALLEIAGRPMIQWVLDALNGSDHITRIVVAGLPAPTRLESKKSLTFLANQGGMLENISSGARELLDIDPMSDLILVVSSDIPAINTEMVNWLIATVQETQHDFYYNVISRDVMEKRFPGSHRTYTHIKGQVLCGGDMNAIRGSMFTGQNLAWNRIIAARKSPIQQASLIGFDTLLLLLLRQLSIPKAEQIISKRLGIRGRAILCPYAEIGMDVDKPNQLEIIRNYLTATRPNELAIPA